MAKGGSQKRIVELRLGKKKVVLENAEGHVWMRTGNGTSGFPLHDAKKEASIFSELLEEWQAHGYVIAKDTGPIAATPSVRTKKNLKSPDARWIADADEILTMWAGDDYDNLKDAILDARGMLRKPPAAQKARIAKLERMLAAATKQLAQLVEEDPSFASYAKGLIPATPKKRAKRT